MHYPYSVGNRVLWLNPESQEEIKGTITRLWKTKAEITDRNFQKHKVDLADIELVPVVAKSSRHPTPHTLPPIPDGDRSEFRGQSEEPDLDEFVQEPDICSHQWHLLDQEGKYVNYCWRCNATKEAAPDQLKEQFDRLLRAQAEAEEVMRRRGDSERNIASYVGMYQERIDWIRGQLKDLGDIDSTEKSKEPESCPLNKERSPSKENPIKAIAPQSFPDPWESQEPVAIKSHKLILPQEQEELEKIAKQRGLHYEWKMIGKHGPYLYVRWRENGQHKSTTLKNYIKKIASK